MAWNTITNADATEKNTYDILYNASAGCRDRGDNRVVIPYGESAKVQSSHACLYLHGDPEKILNVLIHPDKEYEITRVGGKPKIMSVKAGSRKSGPPAER